VQLPELLKLTGSPKLADALTVKSGLP